MLTSTGATSRLVAVTGRINGQPGMVSVSNKTVDHEALTVEIPFVSTTGGVVFN